LAGTALAVEGRAPAIRVMAGEPAIADDAKRSLERGTIQTCVDPKTVADGLRTTSIGDKNFAVIARRVERIVAVTEAEILEAMRFVWERIKIVIEPSSAVAVAPLLCGKLDVRGKKVGVVISGGNVDLDPLFQAYESKTV
jgi:threonine dehydratase